MTNDTFAAHVFNLVEEKGFDASNKEKVLTALEDNLLGAPTREANDQLTLRHHASILIGLIGSLSSQLVDDANFFFGSPDVDPDMEQCGSVSKLIYTLEDAEHQLGEAVTHGLGKTKFDRLSKLNHHLCRDSKLQLTFAIRHVWHPEGNTIADTANGKTTTRR